MRADGVLPPVDGSEEFVGRREELRRIQHCIDKVHDGVPCLVLIDGEAGIGKTALVRQCIKLLGGFHVLYTQCDSSTQSLPYETVFRLGRSAPTTSRNAVPLAPGQARSEIAPAVVGDQLLRLIAELQADGPVALIVEDAQYADPQSVKVLGYTLRRSTADQLLTVVTATTADSPILPTTVNQAPQPVTMTDDWRHLVDARESRCDLHLSGLSAAELGMLADAMLSTEVSRDLIGQLHDYTRGHPLYSRMLLTELDASGRRPWQMLTIPKSFITVVLERLASLPAASRQLVEAMAVLNARCRIGLVALVAAVDDPVQALEPLLESGLVNWWPSESATPTEIRHPLLREAIYASIAPQRRRQMHQSASGLVDRHASWLHRVAASGGVDPDLADELEFEAGRAIADGGIDHASRYLLWSAELSANRNAYERRLLTAAVHLLWTNRNLQAKPLEPAAQACFPSALRSTALGLYALQRSDVRTARRHLEDAVGMAKEAGGPEWLEPRILSSLAWVHLFDDGRTALQYARTAVDHRATDALTRPAAVSCLVAGQLVANGPRAALAELDALANWQQSGAAGPGDLEVLVVRSRCLLLAGELDRATADATEAVRLVRGGVASRSPEQAFLALADAQYMRGAWNDAVTSIDHGVKALLAAETSWFEVPIYTTATLVAAGHGDYGQAERHLQLIRRHRHRAVLHGLATYLAMAQAGLAQARCDHAAMAAAFDALRMGKASGPGSAASTLTVWWLPMYAESMIATNQPDRARRALDQVRELAEDAPALRGAVPWLSGWFAQVSGDLRAARIAFESGLARPVGANDRLMHRARLEQAYGHLLLAMHDRRGAITSLTQAHRRFAAIGARPFLERCAADLNACGLELDTPSRLDLLTEREREVVYLVARGLTNRQAAAQLYVTEKTVEYHLGNVYAKLGIASRRQLRTHPVLRGMAS